LSVTITNAINLILQSTTIKKSEIIPIENSLDRICAEKIKASVPLPPFNNSAMDGFGLCGECDNYSIVGKILAGDDKNFELLNGECITIMTGAKVPTSVERIIPSENTINDNDEIIIKKPVKQNANIRYLGEDINIGEMVLSVGDFIDASCVGLLASQGITHIRVYQKPKISIFANGSELKLHFEKLQGSQIYNSNTPHLIARAKELGCETTFVGKSNDDIDSLKALIDSLNCDIIITSGGVSVGEADFTKEAFTACGMDTIFSKVEIKPGKPTTFGKVGNTLVLNLPGNPLASALNFELFGKLMIAKMSGLKTYHHNFIETKIASDFIKNRKVDTILPGTFDGKSFEIAKQFSPGMVNVLNNCNGFIVLNSQTLELKKGDNVKFLPIKWAFMREDLIDFTT